MNQAKGEPYSFKLRGAAAARCVRFLAMLLPVLAASMPLLAQPKSLRGLDETVLALMERTHMPGVAVAVVGPGGEALVLKGYGVRQAGGTEPIDKDTVFAIGSMTKNFTATALGLLVESGKLDWTAPLSRYVPGLRFSEPALYNDLNLLDALSHRAGLERGDLVWFSRSGASRDEMVAAIERLPLQLPFRSGYLYNNFMYLAAGQAIPPATGQSWDEFLAERLFGPLNMTRTVSSIEPLANMDNVASPHLLTSEVALPVDYYNLDHLGPAGSINSTVSDMANWCRMQLSDGQFGESEVVPSSVLKAVRTPRTFMTLATSGHAGTRHKAYAMGLERMNYGDDLVLYTHGGAINGMSSNVAFVPEAGYCVVVLTNGATGTKLRYFLTDWILDRLLGLTPASDLANFESQLQAKYGREQAMADDHAAVHDDHALLSLPIETLAGIYRNPVYGDLSIFFEDGELHSQYGRTFRSTLVPHSTDVFDLLVDDADRNRAQPSPLTLAIHGNRDGVPESVLLEIPGASTQAIRFQRVDVKNSPGLRVAFDAIIENGIVFDGSGGPGIHADVGIRGDRITAVGDLSNAEAAERVDAAGLVVTPGFINMLSHGPAELIADGRGMSDISQGVTLEVFGEGGSMGPLNESMKQGLTGRQGAVKYEIEWDTLGGFLDYLAERGVSPNIASYVGATTLRIKHLGFENRRPSSAELSGMQADVAQAMKEGAMGVSSALIYAPGFFADTDELIALVDVASHYGGSYITHMRSEGVKLLEAVDEVLEIARATGASVEIHHLKAAGQENWPKMDEVISRVEAARAEGIDIRANMYPYIGGSTGLNATMPPWVQEGGYARWVERLQDPEIREQIAAAIVSPADDWENMYVASGGAEHITVADFRNPSLQPLAGKTLAEIAQLRGASPAEIIMDLVIEDGSRVESIYFMMSEDNLKKQMARPWVSFQSDAPVLAPEGVFLQQSVHPRAYGTFARIFAKYVREEHVLPLEEAVRRLTSLPANNLRIKERGLLKPGYFADVVVFDAQAIQDQATFTDPHRLSTGVEHVFVNGTPVWRDGEHTGRMAGRVVHGPGYQPH